jgi:hypothetical protein
MNERQATLFEDLADKVDWGLLHKQRLTLAELLIIGTIPSAKELNLLEGVLHLLDRMQDTAEEAGLWKYPETCDYCGVELGSPSKTHYCAEKAKEEAFALADIQRKGE